MQKTPRVTYEQVQQAMEAISTRGQKPTIANVRTELGGGSPNTILNFMNAIRATTNAETPVVPVLPDFFIATMERLLRDVRVEAEGAALEEIERMRVDMAALQDGARQAEVDFSDLMETLKKAQEEIAALHIALAETKTAHNIAVADVIKTQEQMEKFRNEAEQARLELAKAEIIRDAALADRDKSQTEAVRAQEHVEKSRREAEDARVAAARAEIIRDNITQV